MTEYQSVLEPDIDQLVPGLSESVGGAPVEGNAPGNAGPTGQPHVQTRKIAGEVTDYVECLSSEKPVLLNSSSGVEVAGRTVNGSHAKRLKPRP